MVCFKCGKTIPKESVICPECGSSIIKDQIEVINDYCESEIKKIINKRKEIADKA